MNEDEMGCEIDPAWPDFEPDAVPFLKSYGIENARDPLSNLFNAGIEQMACCWMNPSEEDVRRRMIEYRIRLRVLRNRARFDGEIITNGEAIELGDIINSPDDIIEEDCIIDQVDLYHRVASYYGIAFNERTSAHLRDEGRGPTPIAGAVASPGEVARYLGSVFDIPHGGTSPPNGLRDAVNASTVVAGKRPWIVAASDDLDTQPIVNMLETLGAESVMRATTELDAAQVVSQCDVAGVIWMFDGMVDAELIATSICRENGIAYVMVTTGPRRPASMSIGGVVVHNPHSLLDILAALESLPQHKITGLDFTAFTRY